ncbi:calmodulin-binding transcription activator 6-like isoform X2 [Cynara cardunculus var. scolymus]|uniref:calmodulin-binding transcription activator 6-like isoform X2 n=1 Tax=Cynara cardunculus var. scolymus TaxID=59895 RepID=UPI000D627711|nr:calmodulin-binding transcription activator 6-like isoform X2 [Cynara cardunculus var. scolymus]
MLSFLPLYIRYKIRIGSSLICRFCSFLLIIWSAVSFWVVGYCRSIAVIDFESRGSFSEMEPTLQAGLVGSEIHGFKTMKDLDIPNMMEEAKTRWLRPNEIHAVLYNHKYFNISVKPVNLPPSGTIVLFDRKMLRNFRKDGHNWKKKKDGKTVKEAHEHLKVGNNERIHVYYAHGEDRTTLVRRCYWLLDKKLEHIVLVHYRDTQELQGSPVTPVDSNSSSDLPTSSNQSEEIDGVDQVYFTEPNETVINHKMRIHEINTLEWDELVIPNDSNKLLTSEGGNALFDHPNQYGLNGTIDDSNSSLGHKLAMENPLATFCHEGNSVGNNIDLLKVGMEDARVANVATGVLDMMGKEGLPSQDSFRRWMNYIITDSPGAIDDPLLTPEPLLIGQESLGILSGDRHESHSNEQIFSITEVSPAWALSSEETKILVVGVFQEKYLHLLNSNLFCVCGDACVPAEIVQSGVFRCMITPQSPGIVNLFISSDGHKPISQLMAFEFQLPPTTSLMDSLDEKPDWQELQIKMRLSHLLFSSSKSLTILSSKVPQKTQKEAIMFVQKSRHIVDSWDYLVNSITEKRISFQRAKNSLMELTLQNRLLEWLLEKVLEGGKIPDRDDQGQGVIHLCAILDYNWAIYPYSWSGLSLDFRDKSGWTALHWAAHYGRQRMVASLLSAGANPNLVTDPTSENTNGCTPADLASKSGYEGLAAYLAEKSLVAHFEAMTLAGNVSGSLQSTFPTNDDFALNTPSAQINEDEQYLKDTLAAYRTAADAAARIQAAFREQSFKLRTKEVESSSTEDEARSIIAAMRIQHAFRNHETKKQMAAAARIQHRFRTWKIRKDFLNKRRQVIKIQAIFRGHQVRRQYTKIVWSVGVLEKAILRWRLKRRGFRGLQVDPNNVEKDENQENNGMEGFFRASRKQAEERVERSVVRVQAMFRSKRAQEEYRKMKQEHLQASHEYDGSLDPATDMEK